VPHGRAKAPPAAVAAAIAAGAKAPRAAACGCHCWVHSQPGLLGCLREGRRGNVGGNERDIKG
jgi:hypothetical protein